MIILEGPDGGGKSTLAKHLAQQTCSALYNAGGPSIDAYTFMRRVEAELRMQGTAMHSIVCDRFTLLSEPVYARALQNRAWELPSQHWIETHYALLRTHAPIIIYCRPTIATLVQHAKDKLVLEAETKPHKPKEHAELVVAKLPEIIFAYDELMEYLYNQYEFRILQYDRSKQL